MARGFGMFPRSTGGHRSTVPPGQNLATPFRRNFLPVFLFMSPGAEDIPR